MRSPRSCATRARSCRSGARPRRTTACPTCCALSRAGSARTREHPTQASPEPSSEPPAFSPLPSLTSQCSLSHSHTVAAGSATSEARGFALTQRALGLAQADGGQRRRSAAGAPRPRFVLCNGQAATGGGAQVAWANAYACRCGLRLTEEAKEALSRDQRRKWCGKAGRTQTQSDARAKGKSTRAAGAATSGKRKRK